MRKQLSHPPLNPCHRCTDQLPLVALSPSTGFSPFLLLHQFYCIGLSPTLHLHLKIGLWHPAHSTAVVHIRPLHCVQLSHVPWSANLFCADQSALNNHRNIRQLFNGILKAMNSLNIVSRLTSTPPPSPSRSRTSSFADRQVTSGNPRTDVGAESVSHDLNLSAIPERLGVNGVIQQEDKIAAQDSPADEKTPLLHEENSASHDQSPQRSRLWQIPKRVADAILYGATVCFTTLTAPGRYVIACFYDEAGHFSAILPMKNFRSLLTRRRRKSTARAMAINSAPDAMENQEKPRGKTRVSQRRSPSVDSNASSTSAATSDGETENETRDDTPSRNTRSKRATTQHGNVPERKSGRVKLLANEEALRKRKAIREKKRESANLDDVAVVASALKSPSSPSVNTKLTRYPRAPAPPRPLVPRRQPSYTLSYSAEAPKKTLIIDLDETLIHSMAKGGRMSTGHMVEVRLGGPVSSSGVQIGPGVPILYYVHERPGCHDFLRKVTKWYNLVVFTASVQEYADPVIDWLERERKYFSSRYYRQHCTFRNGAYIKDLAQVEPDLSKVMILDNSPMSYIFHEGKPTCFSLLGVLTLVLTNAPR